MEWHTSVDGVCALSIIYICMSIQSIVPLQFNGEQFYTHTSWFSEKQYNAWTSIPLENRNLSAYYAFSTLAVLGIVQHRSLSSSAKAKLYAESSPATAGSQAE